MKENRTIMQDLIADYISSSVLLYMVGQNMDFDEAFYNSFSNSIETELWDDILIENLIRPYVVQDEHGMYVISDEIVSQALKNQIVDILHGLRNENDVMGWLDDNCIEKSKEVHGDLYKFLQSKLPKLEDS